MNRMESRDSDDQRLLGELGEALAGSRHPGLAGILARARAVYTLRDLDGELARLVHDSAPEVAAAGRRGPPGARLPVFESPRVSVEIEVSHEGIVGQLAPPSAAQVVVEASDGTRTTVDVDDLGYFSGSLASRGLIRLRIDADGGRSVTQWAHVRASPRPGVRRRSSPA